jgi:hypothetical protein
MAAGCELFDLNELKLECSPETFIQLYECGFIDDANSAFLLSELLKCGVLDTRWPDFKPRESRPFGNRPVWIGYDPARNRDSAVITVLAPPNTPQGKFRVLEKIIMNNQNWAFQAEMVKTLHGKYSVEHIGIDCTGPGSGVFERVLEFYPGAMAISYNVETKTKLVLKAQEIISSDRICWDSTHTDIAPAFLSIRRQSTGSNITYVASRDENVGHADVAWSIMHALIKEGLKTHGAPKSSYVIG